MPDLTFDAWMTKVDSKVIRTVGLSVHDLADQPFRDWYDDDMTPDEAAQLALAGEGWVG